MAKLKSKTAGSTVNLRIKFCFGEKIDFFEYANVSSNGIFGLLRPESIKGSNIYLEPFSGMKLKDVLSSGISRSVIVRIIEQILLVVMEVEGIGIPRSSLLMDLNSIYMDDNEIKMICSSAVAKGKNHFVSDLIKEILNAYSTEEAANLNFRRKFLEYLDRLNGDDIYRIEDFLVREKKRIVLDVRDTYYARLYKKLSRDQMVMARVDEIRKNIGLERAKIASDEDEQTFYLEDEPTGYIDNTDYDGPTGYYGAEDSEDVTTGYYRSEDDDDRTTGYYRSEYDGDEPTGYYESDDSDDDDSTGFYKEEDVSTELAEANAKSFERRSTGPKLIRKSNGETIYINKPYFRLGREKGNVDYCIIDNQKISRAHADLVLRGRQWYIVDLRSTNHTSVNDRILQATVETPLQDGDVIKLSSEEFVFCLKD